MSKITLPFVKNLIENHGSMFSTSYDWVVFFIKNINDIQVEWFSDYDKKYHGPVTDRDLHTFNGCCGAEFTVKDGKVWAILTIFNGDMFDGHPTNERLKAKMMLNHLPDMLKSTVEATIEGIAKDMYEHELHLARLARIKTISDTLYDSCSNPTHNRNWR